MSGNHSFNGWIGHKKNRRIPWPYCTKCGLVRSNGEGNREEATKPCKGYDDDSDTNR